MKSRQQVSKCCCDDSGGPDDPGGGKCQCKGVPSTLYSAHLENATPTPGSVWEVREWNRRVYTQTAGTFTWVAADATEITCTDQVGGYILTYGNFGTTSECGCTMRTKVVFNGSYSGFYSFKLTNLHEGPDILGTSRTAGYPIFYSDSLCGSTHGYGTICDPCTAGTPFLKMTVTESGTSRVAYSLPFSGTNPFYYNHWKATDPGQILPANGSPFGFVNDQDLRMAVSIEGDLLLSCVSLKAFGRYTDFQGKQVSIFDMCDPSSQTVQMVLTNIGNSGPATATFDCTIERNGCT